MSVKTLLSHGITEKTSMCLYLESGSYLINNTLTSVKHLTVSYMEHVEGEGWETLNSEYFPVDDLFTALRCFHKRINNKDHMNWSGLSWTLEEIHEFYNTNGFGFMSELKQIQKVLVNE